MAEKLFRRPVRGRGPIVRISPLTIPAVPPAASGAGGVGATMRLLLPMMAGLGAASMLFSAHSPMRMLAGVVMITAVLISGVGAALFSRTGGRKQAREERLAYVGYIDRTRRELDRDVERFREAIAWRHPQPRELVSVVRDRLRLWERRPDDIDFLVVRIGIGRAELARPVGFAASSQRAQATDPVAQAHADRLMSRINHISNIPLAVRIWGVVSVLGDPERTTVAVDAMATQLVTFHAPQDVQIMICATGDELRPGGRWEWVKWLPHLASEKDFDGPSPARRVSQSADETRRLLGPLLAARSSDFNEQQRGRPGHVELDAPRLVVFLTTEAAKEVDLLELFPGGTSPRQLNVALVVESSRRVQEPSQVDTRIRIDSEGSVDVQDLTGSLRRVAGGDDLEALELGDGEDDTELQAPQDVSAGDIAGPIDAAPGWAKRLVYGSRQGTLDTIPRSLPETIARHIAPMRLVADPTWQAPLESTVDLARLLSIDDVATADVKKLWEPRPLQDFLNVPFGVDSYGNFARLDIKESGQQGMGPHGLCIGATGSGKSELLRTMLTSFALTHSPERLALVLVDYKGGAAFAGLDKLPHTSAMVSNLADDLGLVDRLHDALLGEIQRRQIVLADAGNLANVTDYNLLRDSGESDLPPLPNMWVVIDEFGEILVAKPEFIELFVQIGRIGRSIGMHLLLSTQRLEEGRLRGLESHLSYRIGLRTFTAQESRTALGVSDAHALPPIPGSGILKVDPDVFQRFKAGFVSGPYKPSSEKIQTGLPEIIFPFDVVNTAEGWLRDNLPSEDSSTLVSTPLARTTMDVAVENLASHADKVHQIWLPPLPDSLTFQDLLGTCEAVPGDGFVLEKTVWSGKLLSVPIGLADQPLKQRQIPCEVDFRGSGGNLCICGAPQAGKSTLLRSLIVGAVLTHSPRAVGFHIIDATGGALDSLEQMPNVGTVANRFDPDRIHRVVADVHNQLTSRERILTRERVTSIDDLRGRSDIDGLEVTDLFLVIDGWSTFKEDFEVDLDRIQDIGNRGLGVGIHLVISTGRWADLRLPMQAIMGSKVELRLNDALDSSISRKLLSNIRAETPGRAVTNALESMSQVCMPKLSPDGDLTEVAAEAKKAWAWCVPSVPMLPTEVDYQSVVSQWGDELPGVIVGVSEDDLGPFTLDLFGVDRHLLVIGDSKSGKSTFAKALISGLVGDFDDDQMIFGVFDVRRSLLGFVPDDHLGGYAGSIAGAGALAGGIAGELEKRLPPDDLDTDQLRDRSWWAGPEIVLIADDFDVLSPSGPGPLAPLLRYLPHAEDIGLHVVILRRSAGISRALYDPAIAALREHGATGVLLSGDRQEGNIFPGHPLSHQPPGRASFIRSVGGLTRVQLLNNPFISPPDSEM